MTVLEAADVLGSNTGKVSTSPDADTRMRELSLMNASLHKWNEHLQQEIKALLTQLQRLDLSVLSSSELHMYTGLNRNSLDILLQFLEPVVPSYGNNLEEIHAMHQRVHTHLTTSQKLLMTLMRI